MCEYCSGEKKLHYRLCVDWTYGKGYHIAFIDRESRVLRQYIRSVYPDGRVEDGEYTDFHINRCPMCGEVLD